MLEDEETFQKAMIQAPTLSNCLFSTNRGLYLPSTDTLRIRVVFAKFQDDTDNISYWPQAGFPAFANTYVDSTASVGSTHRFNLTNYYRTFTRGQFIVVGKVDTVTVSQSMTHLNFVGAQNIDEDYLPKTFNANEAALKTVGEPTGIRAV